MKFLLKRSRQKNSFARGTYMHIAFKYNTYEEELKDSFRQQNYHSFCLRCSTYAWSVGWENHLVGKGSDCHAKLTHSEIKSGQIWSYLVQWVSQFRWLEWIYNRRSFQPLISPTVEQTPGQTDLIVVACVQITLQTNYKFCESSFISILQLESILSE